MKKNQIIRAWKNPDYRQQLEESFHQIPDHPAGWLNLTESELNEVMGGEEAFALELEASSAAGSTFGCCTFWRICDGLNTNYLGTYGCCPSTNGF
jgi:mersacidin/lichenicidin family type 2 lantibiotic